MGNLLQKVSSALCMGAGALNFGVYAHSINVGVGAFACGLALMIAASMRGSDD